MFVQKVGNQMPLNEPKTCTNRTVLIVLITNSNNELRVIMN